MQRMTLRDVKKATDGRILRGSSDIELTGVLTDTKTLRPGELFFALHGERFDAHQFLADAARLGAAAAVVHKKDVKNEVHGLPLVLVENTTRALGDLAHWHRTRCLATVIGITGSNGKTTTKEMLFHILDGVVTSLCSVKSFNNAIGVPLTLLQLRPDHVYAVIEMGTNSPGEIARLCEVANPDLGLITTVTETHIEGLGSLEGIAREKSALLRHTARRCGGFYNADNFWTRQIAKSVKGTLSSFGAENEATYRMLNLRVRPDGLDFKLAGGPRIHVPVLGSHNAMNTLAAIAVARKIGIDWTTIVDRLATFRLPPMRMETTAARGVVLINDAYNANPASAEAAARTLSLMECKGRKIFVLADMLELGPGASDAHRKLGKLIAGLRFDYLFGLGPLAAEFLAAAAKHGMDERDLHPASSAGALAKSLLELVQPGDAVLFKGSRGMHLEEAIELLKKGLAAGTLPPAEPIKNDAAGLAPAADERGADAEADLVVSPKPAMG